MTKNIYNLDEAMSAGRQSIDAKWSARTKRLAASAAIILGVGAISGGLWAASAFSTPGLPGTAEEALAVLGSSKFERMSADRKSAYAEEAGRLLRDLPEESRRDMFRDEEQRKAMWALMEQRMADMARAVARGEPLDFASMFGDRPRGNTDRSRWREEMTDEERAQRRAEMQERMRERTTEMFKSGNAQTGELMGEMFRSGGFGGGGRRGGGRGGGGRG